MQKHVPEGDALDDFLTEMPKPVVRPPPMAHDAYLKRLDSMPRLLTGNVFPGACYRAPTISVQAGMHQRPWMLSREANRKEFYHRPNEFSDLISAASRMGLNLYAKKSKD